MDLHYREYSREYDREDGEDGPALVILHGFLGASGNWHSLSKNAFAPHLRVFAVDQRNHGRSPHTDVLDYPSMADDLRGFLDRHGLDRVHLLGHSMGGKTAMFFALAHPERVDKLVVVDIAPRAYPPQHREILDALRAVDPRAHDSRQSIDAALSRYIGSDPVRQFLLKSVSFDSARRTYEWDLNLDTLHTHYDRINVGLDGDGRFDGPTLFVRGERSDYIRNDDKPLIRHYFPNADLVSVPGAGHWVHADSPKAFAEVVLRFLR